MQEVLTIENTKLLLDHCRDGRLYEIEKWIASGESLLTHPASKKIPLYIAIESGFHSLVELLTRHEQSQEVKNRGLSEALSKKRLDLIRLLVDHGAEIGSVPLIDALLLWDPAIIRFFLDNGADAVTNYPFAMAFQEKIRTALRQFVEYRKAHPELAAELQEQADRALRYFACEGDLKWTSLLMWAGANPRSRGPGMDERYSDDPECYTTAVQEACYKGNVEILKKFKTHSSKDNLAELLSYCSISKSRDLIRYLLSLGATPNDRANGGSSILHQYLCHLAWSDFQARSENRLVSKYSIQENMECIQELVEHGAQWRPEDRNEMNYARQSLLKCEPSVTVSIVKLLSRHSASPIETLEQLLKSPKMRAHLSGLGMKL